MEKNNYYEKLTSLIEEESIIKRSIDTENVTREQKDFLFKQLRIIDQKKASIEFKIRINERLKRNEKSR